MDAFALTPLPSFHKRIKQDYYQAFKQQGFKGYQSPWLPVSAHNLHLLQAGDLVIDDRGIETPYQSGRDILHIKDGKVVSMKKLVERGEHLRLVWVDARQISISKYLEDASDKDKYDQYSQSVQLGLRKLAEMGIAPTEEVQFPLYHETDLESAKNILTNGFDIFIICGRSSQSAGQGFFSASHSIETAKGKGNFHGALIKLLPAEGARPMWLDNNHLSRARALMHLDLSFVKEMYSWSTFASEISASAYSYGESVFIFNSFEAYKPAEIIVNY
jgi:hypothetical protein